LVGFQLQARRQPHEETLMPDEPARFIDVEGVLNFRDRGGYETTEGNRVRWRRVFRAGALHEATAKSASLVRNELGVRSVFDLRFPNEVDRPGTLGLILEDPVTHHHLSIIPDGGSALLDEEFGRGISGPRYGSYLKYGADRFASMFNLLAETSTYPAIIHCSAGKDRTGVSLALLLDLLGVDHDTIRDDYDLSNRSLDGLMDRVRAAGNPIEGATHEDHRRLYGAPPEAMAGFLEHLRSEHGSARAYLESIGVPSANLDTIREGLLE
jgi:protein-tyrosine phosphatase